MKLFMHRDKLTDIKNRLVVAKGITEEERIGSLTLADVNYYILDGYTTRSYCTAWRTIVNIL